MISVGFSIKVADSFFKKLLGIALVKHDEVLLICNCRDVHTFWLKKNLDIAFIDKAGLVVDSHIAVRPWKRLKCKSSYHVMERFSSDADWLKAGENIQSYFKYLNSDYLYFLEKYFSIQSTNNKTSSPPNNEWQK